MKRRKFLSILSGLLLAVTVGGARAASGRSPEPAEKLLRQAMQEAASRRRPILVLFGASW